MFSKERCHVHCEIAGETAQILVEFLEVAITSVVFLKGVYPSGKEKLAEIQSSILLLKLENL